MLKKLIFSNVNNMNKTFILKNSQNNINKYCINLNFSNSSILFNDVNVKLNDETVPFLPSPIKERNDKRIKLVVLGTGWASFRLIKSIDMKKFRVVVISPRNHFLFTPLLPSTSTGTLDFRSIIEPIRSSKIMKSAKYYHGRAFHINQERNEIRCLGALTKREFVVDYDALVIGVGAKNNTFNIPGVEKYAHFLKELYHARKIRTKIIECFEVASLPSTSTEERKKLLHFVVVGGGPTGTEFCGELSDFFWQDLTKSFPEVSPKDVNVTLLEAGPDILLAFDKALVKRAIKTLKKQGVNVRTESQVKEVFEDHVLLHTGEKIFSNLIVWSTGVSPRPIISQSTLPKDDKGRLITNKYLQVKGYNNIFAIGDAAEIEGTPLQATAQVAQQQGYYVSKLLNSLANKEKDIKPFKFHFLGLMTYVGSFSSLIDSPALKSSGIIAFIGWRSAYLTKLGSIKNRLQVPMDWLRTLIFGRDSTSF